MDYKDDFMDIDEILEEQWTGRNGTKNLKLPT